MLKSLGQKEVSLEPTRVCHHGPRDHKAVTARICMLLCFFNCAIAWCFLYE